MAKTLDYIAKQITNLNNTINGNELLENEGIIVENNQIIDFENLFWDPQKELN
mgnify:CR=1 FL=1